MALTRITKGVIKPNENYQAGIVTATGLDVNGNGDISGNLNVGGVLTYEDVTSIDSVGIVTAREGIRIPFDNKFLLLGQSNDLSLAHTAGHSYIADTGTGDLRITGSVVRIQNAVQNEDLAVFTQNGSVELYYNNNLRLATVNYGVNVIGQTTASQLRFKTQEGTNRAMLWADNSNNVYLYDAQDHTIFKGIKDGAAELYHDNVKRLETSSVGVSIPQDLDVDGHTNLDNVSIAGVTTVSGNLIISNNDPSLTFTDENANPDFKIRGNGGSLKFIDVTDNNADRMAITNSGNVLIYKDLDVDGHTNLDNVSIAGVTTTTGDVTVGSGGENSALGVRINSAYAQIKLPDGQTGANEKGTLFFGDGDDFTVVHDGYHNYVRSNNGWIIIKNSAGNNAVIIKGTNATEVYHATTKVLETSAKGIQVGTGVTVETNGQATYAGIVTATSFSGSGANLTSLPAQATIANNADNRVITGGSGVNLNGEANFTFSGNTATITASSGYALVANGASTGIGLGSNGAIVFGNQNVAAYATGVIDASELKFNISGSPRVNLKSSVLLIGNTSSQEVYGTNAVQIQGTTAGASSLSLLRHGNSPYLTLGSSGGSALNAVTALSDDDRIGQINFAGADGTDINTHAASIAAYVDGSVSSNNVPARIVFSTGPSETSRMTIDSSGNVILKTANAAFKSESSSSGDYVRLYAGSGTGKWDIYGNGQYLRISDNDSAGSVRIDTRLGVGSAASHANLCSLTTGTGAIPTTGLIQTNNDNHALQLWNTSNSATYCGLMLETRTSGASGWLIANEWKSTYAGDLVFRGRSGGTSSSERLRITSGGDVGINVTPISGVTLQVGTPNTSTGVMRGHPDYFSIDSGSSSGGGVVGTVSNPALIFGGDGNTGLYHSAADTLNFTTGGAERLRIKSNGQIILGNVNNTSGNTNSALHIESTGMNVESSYDTDDVLGAAPHLTLSGQSTRVRMDMGTMSVSPYAGWIQARYDNNPFGGSGTDDAAEPLVLNPRGGVLSYNCHDGNAVANVGGGGISPYGGFVLRAGRANSATVNNLSTAIKIYPAETRNATVGEQNQGVKFGGIAWHGLDPHNGGWNGYGGHHCWMGMSYHSTPGQEFSNWQVQMNNNSTSGSYATNVAIQANPEGYVTTPNQPSFCAVKNSSNYTFTSGQRTTIAGWSEKHDTHSDFNPTTGVFTAPIAGTYYFYCTVMQSRGGNGDFQLSVFVNSTMYVNTNDMSEASSTTFQQTTIPCIVNLAKNDEVTFRGYNASDTTSYIYRTSYTHCGGYLIG